MRQGLDFFPVERGMERDDKIYRIEQELGEIAFGRLIKLLGEIYENDGYFKPWNDQVAEVFAGKRGLPPDEIKALVACALRVNFLNPDIYARHGVLTSAGIQKRWLEARKRRKQIFIDARYWCLDLDTITGIQGEVIETSCDPPVTSCDPRDTECALSKGNISKVKVSKGKISKHAITAQRPDTKEVAPDVWLTEAEYSRLCAEYPKDAVDGVIDDLSNALGNRYPKDKYRDHNKTIRNWLKRNGAQRRPAPKLCPRCGKPYLGTVCQDPKCGWAK